MPMDIFDDSLLAEEVLLTTLSARLVHALNTLNVTQAELARLVSVKPQAIHYLCSSNSKKSRFTYEIADALKINSLWLATGHGVMRLKDDLDVQLRESQQRVPVLDWKQIEFFMAQGNKMANIPTHAGEWVLTNSDVSPNGFAFRLQDKSMYPRFDHDTLVIINPQRTPKNKDFILTYLELSGVIFRQYEVEKEVLLLKPINMAMYKSITIAPADLIIGVMVEARWQC